MSNSSGARGARSRGSSFGAGPRRGTDPEGGERSAWKGLCGPSGLNLDHSRIPDVERMVYATLTPLVVASHEPVPLSQFSSKACDLLLPVLERQQELTPHEFKSQWGRLNEYVCPELARRAGLGDSGYSREHKTVCLDLRVPSGAGAASGQPQAAAAARPAAAASPSPLAAATPVGTARLAASSPSPAQLPPTPGTVPVAVQLQPGQPLQPGMAPGMPMMALGAPGAALPAACAYCQGPHAMKHCQDFHRMLTSIYQAGYQHGMAAAQQQALAAQPALGQPVHPGGGEGAPH